MNIKDRVDKAFALHVKLTANVGAIRQLTLENYEILKEIQDEELYKDILGDETADFKAYLADVDVFYSRAKVDRWHKIRKRLLTEFGIVIEELYNVPETRLEQIAYLSKDKDHALELLSKAKILLSLDWTNEIRMLKGLPTTDECKHDPREVPATAKCIKCGVSVKEIKKQVEKI